MKRVFSEKVMPLSARPTMKTLSTSQSQSQESKSIASSVPGPSFSTHADDCKENDSPTSTAVLRIAVEDCGITIVLLSILEGMWKKAENLVQSKDVLKLPWSSDVKFRLVKRSSSDHPHIVKTNSRNLQQYLCNDNCPMYKAFLLCSHVIAAAHDNCDLQSFYNATLTASMGQNSQL